MLGCGLHLPIMVLMNCNALKGMWTISANFGFEMDHNALN